MGLIENKFYDDTRFFRVTPNFMAQFGISGKPSANAQWANIDDDHLPQGQAQSNQPGYLTFAKTGAPNSRSTQLFINTGDNAFLDSQGFTPFGIVEGADGLDIVKRVFSEYREKPDQGQIQAAGNVYLDTEFPGLSQIQSVEILQ